MSNNIEYSRVRASLQQGLLDKLTEFSLTDGAIPVLVYAIEHKLAQWVHLILFGKCVLHGPTKAWSSDDGIVLM